MENIVQALSILDVINDDHWTADDLPRIDVVAGLTGIKDLTRKDITSAAPFFTRSIPNLEAVEDDSTQVQETFATEQSPPGLVEQAEQVQEIEEQDPIIYLDQAVQDAEAKVLQAEIEIQKAQEIKRAAEEARDQLIEQREKNVHPHQNQIDIMNYIEGQKLIREKRAGVVSKIIAKAPIDQVMQRKMGYGNSRPKVPLKKTPGE